MGIASTPPAPPPHPLQRLSVAPECTHTHTHAQRPLVQAQLLRPKSDVGGCVVRGEVCQLMAWAGVWGTCNVRLASGEAAAQDAEHSQSERDAEERKDALSQKTRYNPCVGLCVRTGAKELNKVDRHTHGAAAA
jgi:hypothetical protein